MSPKLDRTFAMFEAVEKGLRECIALTQADISSLKSSIDEEIFNNSSQGRVYEYEKQCKAAERYLKRMEYQLSKLEELKDQYELNRRMRDGVRSMGYAYTLSPGRERESALSSIKVGFKEYTESLKKIEEEFESSIGTIMIEMKGIQGFARICPGDVFEITMKYGDHQKWKTRGKILKDGKQQWNNEQVMFKSLLDEVLSIKAVEVRGLGKNVTLGNKLCETRNLFSAHPQLMTINLNSIGTLKLNLIVTWNPLHGVSGESTSKSQTLSRSTSSLFGSMRSLPALFSGSSLSGRLRSGTLPSRQRRSNDIFDQYANNSYIRSQMRKSHSASAGITIKSNSDSTSSGSTSSSLHLTGTSSGFSSASSYAGSASVPGSALTSPDTESAPIILNGRHSAGYPPRMWFLSASVSSLSRTDPAFANKRLRPMTQINELNDHSMSCSQKEREDYWPTRRPFDHSHQDTTESIDEDMTDCSYQSIDFSHNVNNKDQYWPDQGHYQRSHRDMLESMDEGITDRSNDLIYTRF